jgi:hypothetical protein
MFAAHRRVEPSEEDKLVCVLELRTLSLELGTVPGHLGDGARDKVTALLARRTHHSDTTGSRFFMTRIGVLEIQ